MSTDYNLWAKSIGISKYKEDNGDEGYIVYVKYEDESENTYKIPKCKIQSYIDIHMFMLRFAKIKK